MRTAVLVILSATNALAWRAHGSLPFYFPSQSIRREVALLEGDDLLASLRKQQEEQERKEQAATLDKLSRDTRSDVMTKDILNDDEFIAKAINEMPLFEKATVVGSLLLFVIVAIYIAVL